MLIFIYANKLAHRAEIGITRIKPGSILATGKALILQIRSPVATIINPPAQEKSAIISGVIRCNIYTASIARATCTIINGTPIVITENPSMVAKIAAVKRSSTVFIYKIDGSPVIPSCIAPKIPVPLAQNSTRIATNFSVNSSCVNP